MKVIKQFKMGSSYFFKDFEDYTPKDIDELCIVDHFINTRKPTNVLNMKLKGKDVFFYRDMDKDGFIRDTLDSKVPMRVGKFLIPEFCESIGFTVDDLNLIYHLFHELDDKHQYERLICDFYLQNHEFRLDENQLRMAYEEYKRARAVSETSENNNQ